MAEDKYDYLGVAMDSRAADLFPQRRVEGGWTCTVCGQPVDLFAPDQQHPRAFIECRHVSCAPA